MEKETERQIYSHMRETGKFFSLLVYFPKGRVTQSGFEHRFPLLTLVTARARPGHSQDPAAPSPALLWVA